MWRQLANLRAIFDPIELNQPFFELIHSDCLWSDKTIFRNKFLHAQLISFSGEPILQLLSHCLCDAHVSRLVVEIQKLGQVFLAPSYFFRIVFFPLCLVILLVVLHLPHELLLHSSCETVLASASWCMSVEGTMFLVMGPINDT